MQLGISLKEWHDDSHQLQQEPGSRNTPSINFDICYSSRNAGRNRLMDLDWLSHSILKSIHQKRYMNTRPLQPLWSQDGKTLPSCHPKNPEWQNANTECMWCYILQDSYACYCLVVARINQPYDRWERQLTCVLWCHCPFHCYCLDNNNDNNDHRGVFSPSLAKMMAFSWLSRD